MAGRQILRVECTALENGLHPEPHLTIMLRCKGGMQEGARKSPKGKARGGSRASEGGYRGMGGGQSVLEPGRPPQGRLEKGRGRGPRVEGRRPTVLHTQSQDDTAESSRRALLEARQEALHTLMDGTI